uniref:MIP22694p n=1 Tax=Drosophila melanogaster TaxID=7227 RepID=D6W4Q1_DROME|nr:MIP22694p [Drosophila melanogaster]
MQTKRPGSRKTPAPVRKAEKSKNQQRTVDGGG